MGQNTAGTLTNIVARGALDFYLTESPTTTYWSSAFQRHTTFAMEATVQTITQNQTSGSISINRNGDMLFHTYLQVDLPGICIRKKEGSLSSEAVGNCRGKNSYALLTETLSADELKSQKNQYDICTDECDDPDAIKIERQCRDEMADCMWVHWTNAVGQRLIQECRLQIGGATVDKLWGDFLFCYEELSGLVGRRLLEMTGKRFNRQELLVDSQESRRLYVPLTFWYSLSSGAALPLSALQFHSVKFEFDFRAWDELVVFNVPPEDPDADNLMFNHYEIKRCDKGNLTDMSQDSIRVSLLMNNVYLDQSERAALASKKWEALIVQHQHQRVPANQIENFMVPFNHPITELVWTVQRQKVLDTNAAYNFSGHGMRDPIKSAQLTFNNNARFGDQDGKDFQASYFRLVQPYEAHSCIPDQHIYNYNFALHPEDSTTPSGSANFSRIDNIYMGVTLQDSLKENEKDAVVLNLYAKNWNIGRFQEGLFGVAYAN